MARLPTPGGDDGIWGDLLNTFLAVEHNKDGSLKRAADIDAAKQAADEAKQAAQNVYQKPGGGIPKSDLSASVQNSLTIADARDAARLQGVPVASGTPNANQILNYDGSAWRPATISDANIVTISQSKITNLTADLAGKLGAGAFTAKGDLLAATAANTPERLGVGSDGQVLTASSAAATGLAWSTVSNQVYVTGLAADGTTDDGPVIQTVLENLGQTGNGHSYEVVAEKPPTGIIYINQVVQIKHDNVTLRFGSPVKFGPLGGFRIQGELDEVPVLGKPFITVDAAEGSTTITVNNVSYFSVGDYIVIRGARDANGNSLQKMNNSIAAINGNIITLNKPLDDTFLVYNAGTWSNHNSNVTRVLSAHLTGTPTRGDRTLSVDDSSLFTVGDIVQIIDDENTHLPDGTAETTNFKHKEIAEVKEVISSTSIRISHALYHSYNTSNGARVARVLPIRHSTIRDVTGTWAAMSETNYGIEAKYTVGCVIYNCHLQGDVPGGKSWRNQGIRLTDSYFSEISTCVVADPAATNGGQGYGITLYGSTNCTVSNCRISSTRHSVLLFAGTAGNLITGCVSADCMISDYDIHGAECVDNLFTDCIAVGGDSVTQDGVVNKAAIRIGNTSHVEGDHHNVFSDMQIINYQGTAFEIVPASNDNTFRNSRVTGAATGIKMAVIGGNTALTSTNTFIENVDFADVTTLTNIDGGTSSIVQGLTVENCRFIRPTTSFVVNNAQKVRLRRNSWYDPALPAVTYTMQATNVTQLSVKHNDMSGAVRGVKLASCPNARVTNNVMHDLTETNVFEDAGGNTGLLFARNDLYGFTPTTSASGTGPSTGGVIDTGVLYQPDTPLRHGYVEWNFDPIGISGGNGTDVIVSGTVTLMKVCAQTGGLVSNIVAVVGTVGSGLVSGQNFAGIYDSTGTRVAVTADQTTAWGSTGIKVMALTTPITIQAGRDYFVALLVNASPTSIRFVVGAGNSVTTPNAGLTNATRRFATNGTGTSLPASITLSSNSGTDAKPIWVALS